MNGIINFYKPKGMTSHQAVNYLRKKLNIKRIGHTGTLDPEVAGVLPLCVGKATRISEYLLDSDKEYICQLTLGKATETYDITGEVTEISNKKVSEDEIRRTFKKYLGEIEQVPPMYSALRYKGRRLYELAREGIQIERKARKVNIYSNEILNINGETITFKVSCSKGTYIRSLCNDIGLDLGTYGYMSYLIRTKADKFTIDKSLGVEFLDRLSKDEIADYILPIDQGAQVLDAINIEDRHFKSLSHGVSIKLGPDYAECLNNKSYRIYCKSNFIGIGSFIEQEENIYLKMRKVLLV